MSTDELNTVDVQDYTAGRLQASSDRVDKMLKAALLVARRHSQWHVTPVREDEEITLDGPDSRVLWLPSRKIIDITSVTENGTAIDLARLTWSKGDLRPVAMRKRSGGWWTDQYQSIDIVMTHGYAPAEAEDWRQAVLSMVDQMSLLPINSTSNTSDFGLRSKQVDDVTYRWDSYVSMAEEVAFSVDSILCSYSLPVVEFF